MLVVLSVDSSYKLCSVTVCSFNGVNNLSVGKQSDIASIADIGDVSDFEVGDADRPNVSRTVKGIIPYILSSILRVTNFECF